MNVGKRIRELRNKGGMTQKELAEKADISTSYLCDIEVGRTNPSLRTLERISKAFGITMKEII